MSKLVMLLSWVSIIVNLSALLPNNAAAGQVYISVGEAKVKKSLLAFPDTKYVSLPGDSGDKTGIARIVRDAVIADLDYTNLFTMQSRDAFIEKASAGLTLDQFRISDWSTIGTEFLIKTGITVNGANVSYEMRLYDVLGSKQIMGKRYTAKTFEPLVLAHSVGNDIIEALTGKRGIFFSKIAMVCDKTGYKEIWLVNFDGSNPKQLTNHRTLTLGPAWNPTNKKLAYSLFTKNKKNIKNIDLYEYDFASKHARLLSNRKGMNSGAAYSPDGKRVALTMSFLGQPEIFTIEPGSGEATRLTRSLGFDVDPTWSPDGKKIAFVSTRSGQPMVYTATVDDLKRSPGYAKRITFAGVLNATPTWSPNGNKIVFASRNEHHFDLFMINADGSEPLERLTKDEGNNEDPHFSPDGNYVVFSSNRAGQKNIYVMTADGMQTRRITFGLGNCVSPRWSFNSDSPIQ